MLIFNDMETRRLCDIVNEGAGQKLNDIEFLNREINKWLNSPARRAMLDGERYYTYGQDVANKQRRVIGDGGSYKVDQNLPNNRFIDNQFANMVDQKVNYLLSKPLTFKTDNAPYNDALRTVFNKRFHKTLKNLGKDAYNGGVGWLYPYYDEKGEFKIRRFKPYEILPFWKNDEHNELDFAVRYYEVLGYEGHAEKVYKFVEVYDTKGIHKFTFDNNALKPDYQTYYFELPQLDGEVIPYNWDRVPLIPFKSNENELPLLCKCKSLQDGINDLLSNFADSMQENCNGNGVLIIHNYDGTDLGEFRHNLSQYRAIKVSSIDGADGGIDSLQIEVNAENYKTILGELKKALIQNCRGYDIEALKSAGSPNEMSIKSIFSQIDLDANELETEFQGAFEDLLYFVNAHLQNNGVAPADVDVIFDRDLMINESQVIADINASSGLLSKRTLVAMHPFVEDVDAELKQIEQDQADALESFGNSQFEKSNGDIDNGEE